ncbi:tail fiber protein [Chromobacterium violaceum]|uniref:phage tail protein n=1 Tax=Chromobacterium violaceum TaxID=536 RepID=UPI001E5F8DFC|nr:tail fiber protein [Chromobacterium violaceum]MCD0493013.1 tail fiber protein [Chromobacterium violaceum]
MQDLKPINSPDSLFHDGNPATGELGTIVSADWLNGVQSAAQELLTVIKNSGQTPDSTRQDQLLQAVRNIAWGGNSKPTTLAGYGIAIASQAEAEAGTDNVKAMTPLRVEQALNAAGLSGYAKNIASGSLQTVRPNGLYHVDSSLVNGTPDKSNGMLLANFLNDKWGSQIYWMWGGATYEQRLENGNWQPWVKLLKTGQQSTLADYGITDGASKAELQKSINDLVAGAPGALNTLQKLAAALGNDANYAASITKQLSGKADKATTLAGYGIADGATATQVNAAAPAGMVAYFAMKDAPAGWLIADGRAVARKDYPALFAAIGGLYGNGDGSTTFGLPNLCGEFIRGWDYGRGVDTNRNFGTLQTDGIKDHKHAGLINSPYGDNWNYIYGYKNNGPTAATGGIGAFPGVQTLPQIAPVSHDGNPNNAIQTYITLNASSETRPRNIALLACIKY